MKLQLLALSGLVLVTFSCRPRNNSNSGLAETGYAALGRMCAESANCAKNQTDPGARIACILERGEIFRQLKTGELKAAAALSDAFLTELTIDPTLDLENEQTVRRIAGEYGIGQNGGEGQENFTLDEAKFEAKMAEREKIAEGKLGAGLTKEQHNAVIKRQKEFRSSRSNEGLATAFTAEGGVTIAKGIIKTVEKMNRLAADAEAQGFLAEAAQHRANATMGVRDAIFYGGEAFHYAVEPQLALNKKLSERYLNSASQNAESERAFSEVALSSGRVTVIAAATAKSQTGNNTIQKSVPLLKSICGGSEGAVVAIAFNTEMTNATTKRTVGNENGSIGKIYEGLATEYMRKGGNVERMASASGTTVPNFNEFVLNEAEGPVVKLTEVEAYNARIAQEKAGQLPANARRLAEQTAERSKEAFTREATFSPRIRR